MVYEVFTDNISREEWEHYASQFADYSIYQTWLYQQVRAEMAGQHVSRVVIKDKNGQVATMGQVRIKHVKPLGLRIGYVQRGPLTRRKDGVLTVSSEVFNLFREVYLGPRVNVLRIVPNIRNDKSAHAFAEAMEKSSLYRVRSVQPYHTMFLRLGCSEKALREGLHQSWRRQLRKAEKAGLQVCESNGDESFRILAKLYLGTVQRKSFKGLDPQEFAKTQRMLSPAEKMRIIVVYCDGEPVTAHLTSNLGEAAVFLLGGSSEKGLACRASYLAWWRAITVSNRLGMKSYDTGGIDFEKNPTVSRFKAGLGSSEVHYVGAFEVCANRVIRKLWRTIEKAHMFLGS
jgi:hypothetical protein